MKIIRVAVAPTVNTIQSYPCALCAQKRHNCMHMNAPRGSILSVAAAGAIRWSENR